LIGPVAVRRAAYQGEGKLLFPLDDRLGVNERGCTQGLEALVEDAGVDHDFESAEHSLARAGVEISDTTVWRACQQAGEAIRKREEEEVGREPRNVPRSPGDLAVEVDAFCVNTDEGWKRAQAGRARAPRPPGGGPQGSYLALFRAKGFEDLRRPFVVEPSSRADVPVRLLPEGSTPEGFVYVDGGPFVYQGDKGVAVFSFPREVREEPGFSIGRLEVSMGEYFEFVNDPEFGARGPIEELLPRNKEGIWYLKGAGNGRIWAVRGGSLFLRCEDRRSVKGNRYSPLSNAPSRSCSLSAAEPSPSSPSRPARRSRSSRGARARSQTTIA
jgi:hypothetical protein